MQMICSELCCARGWVLPRLVKSREQGSKLWNWKCVAKTSYFCGPFSWRWVVRSVPTAVLRWHPTRYRCQAGNRITMLIRHAADQYHVGFSRFPTCWASNWREFNILSHRRCDLPWYTSSRESILKLGSNSRTHRTRSFLRYEQNEHISSAGSWNWTGEPWKRLSYSLGSTNLQCLQFSRSSWFQGHKRV